MTFSHAVSTNNYGNPKFIVATSPANGTHVTLASAMSAAVSGDTIALRDSVTENVTITPGVNIVNWFGGTLNTSTITGTLTMTGAGTSNISGIRLQTNSAALLSVTGSAASVVNLNNCYLNCTNNTGIIYSSASSSSVIRIINSRSDLTTTGIQLFDHSSTGNLSFRNSVLTNSGSSTTASTASAGILIMNNNQVDFPITLSGTASIGAGWNDFSSAALNVTALTLGGSGSQGVNYSSISSGSASAVSIGGTAGLQNCLISSSNTNAITGGGTLTSNLLSFSSTSNTINTTTQTPLINRFGIQRSTTQPAFLAFLNATALNKTGNGTQYALGTDVLTEVFDQANNFNTNGTFTAPFTGKYLLSCTVRVTGCTIATFIQSYASTSNRQYHFVSGRPASNQDMGSTVTCIADMDAGDTSVWVVFTQGEAGVTDDIMGDASVLLTYISGYLLC